MTDDDDDVDDDDVHDDDVDGLITGEQAKRNTFNFFFTDFWLKKDIFLHRCWFVFQNVEQGWVELGAAERKF